MSDETDSKPASPVHKYELLLRISADSWDELMAQVRDWRYMISTDYPELEKDLSGYGSRWYYDIIVSPDMTPDKYRARLNQYLEWWQEQRANAEWDRTE